MTARAAILFTFAAAWMVAAEPRPLPAPPALAASRRVFEGWRTPVPPRHIVGNIHYVGASGISSYLITTPAGHILLDTGFEDTVPLIARNVAALGFKVADIKFILGSHAHNDHTGGHAAMRRLTRATIVSSAADARLLETGGADDFSPYPKELMRYEPVQADRLVRDGETVALGGTTLTAHLTPGHTRGATTWTMQVDDAGTKRAVVFFSSLSIVESTSLVRQPAYPGIADDFRASLGKLRALPCDIWLTPHGGQFAMMEKFARLERKEPANPFIDPAGWNRLLTALERAFAAQLELEKP